MFIRLKKWGISKATRTELVPAPGTIHWSLQAAETEQYWSEMWEHRKISSKDCKDTSKKYVDSSGACMMRTSWLQGEMIISYLYGHLLSQRTWRSSLITLLLWKPLGGILCRGDCWLLGEVLLTNALNSGIHSHFSLSIASIQARKFATLCSQKPLMN
jgi:hypothetical protein